MGKGLSLVGLSISPTLERPEWTMRCALNVKGVKETRKSISMCNVYASTIFHVKVVCCDFFHSY